MSANVTDLQQLFGRAALLHVHLQTLIQEVPEHRRQLLWMLQLRRAVGCYEIQCLSTTWQTRISIPSSVNVFSKPHPLAALVSVSRFPQ